MPHINGADMRQLQPRPLLTNPSLASSMSDMITLALASLAGRHMAYLSRQVYANTTIKHKYRLLSPN